jgi:ABC-2 type transport system ATP-binding protein
VLLSTHYLEEAESVCDRVAIIDRGEIIALDSPTQLVARVGRQTVDLRIDGEPAQVLVALRELGPSVSEPLRYGSTVSVASSESSQALTERINAAALSRLGVTTTTIRPTTLIDVFLILTSRRAAGSDAAGTVLVGARP